MKKTKKQKILSDLRRKMAELESKNAGQIVDQEPDPHKINSTSQNQGTYSFASISNKVKSFEKQSEVVNIDYLQISRDLKKTIFLSALILVTLLVLKYFLKA